MTKLEETQKTLINILFDQIEYITATSKIELGDDVISEVHRLETEIENLTENYVPFVSEVEEFNALMGKPNTYSPNIPSEKEWMFIYNFVLEELEELKHACETKDIVEILDALCDLQYVSGGNGVMLFGLKDKFLDAYAEVQASNLSKICATEEDAIETVKVRSEQQGEPCHYEKVGEGYVVYRTSDKKVMKSLKYFRPNLHQFFTEEEINNCKN